MKGFAVLIFVFLLVMSDGRIGAQQPPACDSKDLTVRLSCFYQKGDLDSAIPLAEELLKKAKKVRPESHKAVATAYYNVALLRKKRFQANMYIDPELSNKERGRIRNLLDEDAKKAEENFEKAIDLHESKIKENDLQLADARYELAWLVLNYADPLFPMYEERAEKAMLLYTQALEQRESKLGRDHDQTLSAVFGLAEYHRLHSEFEDSIPLYRRYIETIDTKYGTGQKALVPALRAMAEIFVTISDNESAEKYAARVASITNQSYPLPNAEYVLNNRLEGENKRSRGMTDSSISNTNILTQDLQNDRRRFATSVKKKRVPVRIVIDEEGNVIEAASDEADEDLRKRAIADVKTWKFNPVELDGKKRQMHGIVLFTKTTIR